jgi:hypothetical protein
VGLQHVARVDALGGERDEDVLVQREARRGDRRQQVLVGGPRIGRGLEGDELTRTRDACHGRGGRLDVGHVRLAVATERRGHGDEDRVGSGQVRLVRRETRPDRQRGREGPIAHVVDVRSTGVEIGDALLGDVEADHVEAGPGGRHRQRQPHVAEPDDARRPPLALEACDQSVHVHHPASEGSSAVGV